MCKICNYEGFHHPRIRVLLTELLEPLPLNVLIEVHADGLSRYEITVITALRTEDFRMSEGQYVIEFQENESLLKKRTANNWQEILQY